MKKILGTTLATVLLISGPANAEILKNLKVNGQLDIQGTSARNARDFKTRGDVDGIVNGANTNDNDANNDRIGTVVTRLLVDMSWDLLDDVHSMVTLRKNDRHWGDISAAAATGSQGANGSQSANGAGGAAGGVLGNLFVDRANITIDKLFGHADTTLGRQYYGDSGDLIISYGPKDNYGLYNNPIDAARFEMANDWMAFSGLAGKVTTPLASAGGMGAAAATQNTNVRGFDILWKSLPLKAHTFVWNRVLQGGGALGTAPTNASAAGASGLNDNLWVYGVKLRGEAMGGWANLDLAANGGENRFPATATAGEANSANYTGKAFLLDLGYNAEISGVGALTPWVNFGYGSGRSSNLEATNEGFQSISTDYRPGIMNRRFAQSGVGLGSAADGVAGGANFETAGLTNRVVYGLGLNVTPAAWEKLTVGTQLWSFNQQRNTDTGVAPAAGTQRGAKHIGVEYGVTADWKHSENVKVGLGASIYAPGGAIKQTIANGNGTNTSVGNNPATLAFADFSVKF